MIRRSRGFTLIELLIAVAIVGILTAIALPAYKDYVQRGRLTEAFAALGGVQLSAEQYWSNNRTYIGFAAVNGLPAATVNFSYALTAASVSAYKVTATGLGNMAGFSYSIDQAGNRVTATLPTGWTVTSSCWVDRKSGACTQ
jgi:type IV pilus assembly protein PilE